MVMFENESINITKIHTVAMYKGANNPGKKLIKNYSAKLYSNELIFFISGRNKTRFRDVSIDDAPNSLRFLPKSDKEGIYFVEVIEPSVCIDVYFDTEEPLSNQALSLQNMQVLKPMFEKLYNVWQSKKPGYYSKSLSIFYDIIHNIQLYNQKYFTSEQQRKILPSYEYMKEHFSESDFNYRQMCDQSGFSYGYFKELFINQYGMPPIKYVTMLKVEKAKELIITGKYTISEIAEMCGFENVYYFSNVFKKTTGVSPGKYKI